MYLQIKRTTYLLQEEAVGFERELTYMIQRVAVAELFQAPTSFFCACLRNSPEFEPSVFTHGQATLEWPVALGTARNTLTCSVWTNSDRYLRNSSK